MAIAPITGEAAKARVTALEAALNDLVEKWRASAVRANVLANEYDAKGDQAGNAHALLKERRIWTTCADELAAALTPPTDPA